MKPLFFKVKFGWGEDDYLEIPEHELLLATKSWVEKGVYLGQYGFIDFGDKNIQGIVPDYTRTLGYQRGYKLLPDDHAFLERKGIQARALEALYAVRRRIRGEPVAPAKIGESQEGKFYLRGTIKEQGLAIIESVDTKTKKEVSIEEARRLKSEGLLVLEQEK